MFSSVRRLQCPPEEAAAVVGERGAGSLWCSKRFGSVSVETSEHETPAKGLQVRIARLDAST